MASKILQHGTVVSWDDQAASIRILERASILIVDDQIAAITNSTEELDAPQDAEIVDVTDMIITPGFVNAHCHMWQTAYRSMAPDIFVAQYFGWLSQVGQACRSFSADDIYTSCLEGYCEGLNAGVTSYIEHANNNWSSEVVRPSYDAAKDSGARVWWCYDVQRMNEFSTQEQATIMKSVRGDIDGEESLVSMGLAFDGFSMSKDSEVQELKDMMKQVARNPLGSACTDFRSRDLEPEVITTHYLGGPWIVGANSPVDTANNNIQDLHKPIIFSHGGLLTDNDIQALRDHDNFVCITPENEMHEGHGQAASHHVHDHAALGNDTNWNFSCDIVHQARLWLQTVRRTAYQPVVNRGLIPRQNPMSVTDAFLLATRQGGRALRRDDIGVLKVGAKADIVCFDGKSPNMAGWTNPIAAVILHANVGDVRHVLVGGEFRKRDGRLVMKGREWDDFRAKFVQLARRIQQNNDTPPPLPEKFLGVADFGDVEVARM